MSQAVIRQLLEVALNAMTPALPTQFENVDFDPPASGPYQSVNLVSAVDNRVYGNTYYEEEGYLQVLLRYPTGAGVQAAALRAELLRATFARGSTYSQGGVTVTIWKTPDVKPGFLNEDRWCIPVRVPFHAQIFLS